MGLPERIEGEDKILQTIFNIQIDNYRWQNAVALNYEGNSADSYMDVDANSLVGGELIDGKITPMPLGIYRPNDFGSMKEVLDGSVIPATGINPQQIIGDTSKTAFEFAQRIRMASASAEQRLARLENEVFKPVGSFLLSGALTELTVEEWEDMTEEQVTKAREDIKVHRKTMDDYKFGEMEDGEVKNKRRKANLLKITNMKIREDFSEKKKKRKLEYNDREGATLIYDPKMEERDSWIPLVKEYVYPFDYAETGVLPDVIVDSKRMIKDMKASRVQDFQSALNFLMLLRQAGWQGMDDDKVAAMVLDFGEISPQNLLKDAEAGSDTDKRKQALKQMEAILQGQAQTPMPQVASPTPAMAQPNIGNPLQAVAQGTL